MRLSLAFALIVVLSFSFQQNETSPNKDKDKYDMKGDVFLVNDAAQFKLESQGGMSGNYKLKTLNDKDVAFFKHREIYLKEEISNSNPKGAVIFHEVTFYASGQKCEIQLPLSKKNIGRDLYKHGLIQSGEPDEEAISNFVLIHGTAFSDRIPKNPTIIINN